MIDRKFDVWEYRDTGGTTHRLEVRYARGDAKPGAAEKPRAHFYIDLEAPKKRVARSDLEDLRRDAEAAIESALTTSWTPYVDVGVRVFAGGRPASGDRRFAEVEVAVVGWLRGVSGDQVFWRARPEAPVRVGERPLGGPPMRDPGPAIVVPPGCTLDEDGFAWFRYERRSAAATAALARAGDAVRSAGLFVAECLAAAAHQEG